MSAHLGGQPRTHGADEARGQRWTLPKPRVCFLRSMLAAAAVARAQAVIVDAISGKAVGWEPGDNRSLPKLTGELSLCYLEGVKHDA
jgi:hypothetical protein